MGPPAVPLRAELAQPDLWWGSWAAKNDSELMAFVRLRAAYVEDESRFQSFRFVIDRDVSHGTWGGGDGAYGKMRSEDASRMLHFMEACSFGRALLQEVLPRIAPRIDGVGAPRRFAAVWAGKPSTYISQDLLHGVMKVCLLLRSFEAFGAVPGQPPPPSARELGEGVAAMRRWNVVEVGAGPGLHAASFVAALSAGTYSVVDLPTQQHMQYKVLSHIFGQDLVDRIFAFVPSARRAVLADWVLPSYDLFLSTYALSELAPDVRMKYFYNFIVRSRRGFIIDNFQDLRGSGRSLPGDEGDFIGLDLVRRLQSLAFHVAVSTYQQVIDAPLHPSRAVVITWASMGHEEAVGMNDPDNWSY